MRNRKFGTRRTVSFDAFSFNVDGDVWGIKWRTPSLEIVFGVGGTALGCPTAHRMTACEILGFKETSKSCIAACCARYPARNFRKKRSHCGQIYCFNVIKNKPTLIDDISSHIEFPWMTTVCGLHEFPKSKNVPLTSLVLLKNRHTMAPKNTDLKLVCPVSEGCPYLLYQNRNNNYTPYHTIALPFERPIHLKSTTLRRTLLKLLFLSLPLTYSPRHYLSNISNTTPHKPFPSSFSPYIITTPALSFTNIFVILSRSTCLYHPFYATKMSTLYISNSSKIGHRTNVSSNPIRFPLSPSLPVAFSLPSKTYFQFSPSSPSTHIATRFCGTSHKHCAQTHSLPASPLRTSPRMIANIDFSPSASPQTPCKGPQSQRRRSFARISHSVPNNAKSPTSIVSRGDEFNDATPGADVGCTISTPVRTGPRFSTVPAERKVRFHAHRLSSKEDPLWFHKLSSLTFTLSSFIIVLMFPFRALVYGDLDVPGPNVLNPLLWAWAPSCVIQAVTGAQMAFQFRRTDPKSRDVFVNNSIMTLINVWVVLKLCVPLPAPFDSDMLSQSLMTVMTVTVIYMTGVSVYSAPDLIRTRNNNKYGRPKNGKNKKSVTEGTPMTFQDHIEWAIDYMNYIFPFFYPLPFVGGSFLFFVGHSSAWIAEQCDKYPRVRSVALYVNVAAALTIGIISLLVTLRDRKLVSKQTESLGISIISILLTIFLFDTLQYLIGFDVLKILHPHFLEHFWTFLHWLPLLTWLRTLPLRCV